MRPRRRLTEQQERDLHVRQGELTALAQHPAWPVLESVVGERAQKYHREAAAALLGEGMSAERQSYIRGFLKGMQYVLVVPANAETRIEEFLREQAREEAASGSE